MIYEYFSTYLVTWIFIALILASSRTIYKTLDFYKHGRYAIVTLIHYIDLKDGYSIKCPYCHHEFYYENLKYKINTLNNEPDYLYYECPDCHKKVIIPQEYYNSLGYIMDFLGNIMNNQYVNLDTLIYQVKCESCNFSHNFKIVDIGINKISKKPFLKCHNIECLQPIQLSKNNVTILNLPSNARKNSKFTGITYSNY